LLRDTSTPPARERISVVEALRSHTPDGLVPAIVALRSRLEWAVPATRRQAFEQMDFLVGMKRRRADVEQLARAYVHEMARRAEVRWHPQVATRVRVEGAEHGATALAGGRGAILSFMHHGLYDRVFTPLSHLGLPLTIAVYPYMVQDGAPAWIRQHVRVNTLGGARVVTTDIGARGFTELLEGGAMLGIASDVPGRTPVTFAGRQVLGSFGAARLAVATGAPVVLMTSERDDMGEHVRLHPPLEPERFSSGESLLAEIIARHERAVLDWPEASDLPLSRWGCPTGSERQA